MKTRQMSKMYRFLYATYQQTELSTLMSHEIKSNVSFEAVTEDFNSLKMLNKVAPPIAE